MKREDPLAPLTAELLRRILEDPDALAAIADRLTERAQGDLVDQDTLPPTISRRAYLEACRANLIPGSRKRIRRWIAPRKAVLAWWVARAAADNDTPRPSPDELAMKALRDAGYLVDEQQAHPAQREG